MQIPGNGANTNPAAALAEELETANALREALTREQTCLIENNVDGLGSITEEKNKLVIRMSELALQRYQNLTVAGFQPGEAGMQEWLKTAEATPQTRGCWDELLQTATRSKELNRTNGMLIGQHMARNQDSLTLILGNRPGDNIYGPNGQTALRGSSRSIVIG